jgi:hypothetical protein
MISFFVTKATVPASATFNAKLNPAIPLPMIKKSVSTSIDPMFLFAPAASPNMSCTC